MIFQTHKLYSAILYYLLYTFSDSRLIAEINCTVLSTNYNILHETLRFALCTSCFFFPWSHGRFVNSVADFAITRSVIKHPLSRTIGVPRRVRRDRLFSRYEALKRPAFISASSASVRTNRVNRVSYKPSHFSVSINPRESFVREKSEKRVESANEAQRRRFWQFMGLLREIRNSSAKDLFNGSPSLFPRHKIE